MEDTLNVLVTVDLSDAIMDKLKQISPRLKFNRKIVKTASDIPAETWATTDILYTGGIVPEPNAVPRLRWIQSHSAGVDNLIDKPIMNAEDIILTTTSGMHATTMAELTFAMILAFARKIPLMLKHQQKQDWPQDRVTLFNPKELRRSTLGILGYGSIGREIARVAKAFGMEVLATKRDVKQPAAEGEYAEPGTGDPDGTLVDRLYPPEATKSMVALCDFIVVLIPLTSETRGFVNEDILSAMKKTAVIINMARGAVIDEDALIEVLQKGQIGGAGLDVFTQEPLPSTSPLWKLDNVLISPHIGGNTDHYHESAVAVFTENLERYLANKDLVNRVDRKRGY
ncbi:MAG: D-2-hydroxyacid dehydrogenase [Anaerolineae bacterium]|nr:D-2-hydroxyacid dehydrogenase [Anaerolineae bacterium]